MKKVIFTHTDMDGLACGILLQYKDSITKYIDYWDLNKENFHKILNWLEDIDEEIHLTIADLSFTPGQVRLIIGIENVIAVTIYDHHKATEKVIDANIDYVDVHYRSNVCAAKIIALSQANTSTVYDIVDAGDLFKTDSEYFEIGTSLGALVKNEKVFNTKQTDDDYTVIAEMLKRLFVLLTVYEYSDVDVETEWVRIRKSMTPAGETTLHHRAKTVARRVINSGESISDGLCFIEDVCNYNLVAHYICKYLPSVDCICHIDTRNKSVGLRSHDGSDFDVSVIAENFDGGGHPNASGCVFDGDVETFKKEVKEAYDYAWSKVC
jgi:oligoribonuclease NrnB/cAMP/cGMP phosphodiesterase (DHH superfamily)